MIIGIGTDIIEVDRVARAIERDAFRLRIFSEREIEYCAKQTTKESYAVRFAAKEAFFKALGTGWRGPMAWAEVEIINDELGKPSIILSGGAKDALDATGGTHVHVTLSHIKTQAVAFVIIEKL